MKIKDMLHFSTEFIAFFLIFLATIVVSLGALWLLSVAFGDV